MKQSLTWLIICSLLFTSCRYYRLREGNSKTHDIGLNLKTISTSRIIIHVGNAYWELINFRSQDNGFIGTPIDVTPEVMAFYKEALAAKNFRGSKSQKLYLLQLHLFVNEVSFSKEEMYFSRDQIEKAQILDQNRALTTFTFVVGSAAAGFAAIVIFLLIACNCPHVYMHDGTQWHFTNSMFTGAVNPQLERFDFKQIPDFAPENPTINLEIRNELKETQYTNQLGLVAVYHQPGQQIIVDQNGNFSRVKQWHFPSKIVDDKGVAVTLSDENSTLAKHAFQSIDESGFSNLYASFDMETMQGTQLLISLKNTNWGAYVYKEFTGLFGNYYQKWVQSNAKKSTKQLHKNMEKSGIFLKVEIQDAGQWKTIENIHLVGEASFQKIAVNIPEKHQSNKELQIRLRGGFNFWEVNQISLVESSKDGFEIEEFSAKVQGDFNEERTEQLSKNDNAYLIHKHGSPPISVAFDGLNGSQSRTLFLKSKGYYLGNQKFEGKPDWEQLLAINKVGGLSKFSKALYDKAKTWELVLHELGFSEFSLETTIKH